MIRIDTRVLIKEVANSGDPMAALALYAHSMKLGHRKIALLRYLEAKDLSAPLSEDHHAYAQSVVATLSDREIDSIQNQVVERSRLRRIRLCRGPRDGVQKVVSQ